MVKKVAAATPVTPPAALDPITEATGPGQPTYVLGTTHTLSDVARTTGLSLSHVSRVFAGKRTPTVKAARAIAKCLGVTVEELLHQLESVEPAA